MRSYLLSAVAVALIGASSAAFASTTSTGVVKAFDLKAHTLTLQDGTVYGLPGAFVDPGLKAGVKVSILWDMMKGTVHEASTVTITK